MTEEIINKAMRGEKITKDEVCDLLSVATGSREYYNILYCANAYSRRTFDGKGTVFAQIGIDAQGCSVNCKFCSLAKDMRTDIPSEIKSISETVAEAKLLGECQIKDLFLMTTAEFPKELFLEYGRAVRAVLPSEMRLVANVGDFDLAYAEKLKKAGFTGVYHICRLREGIDTCVSPQTRIHTLDAVRDAGMELYYCVEPIGPEHTNDELADEILRAREYPVGVMAVMKRVAVEGTSLAHSGEISAARLSLICAVTVLAAQPERAMGVHEPDELCLMAGANQIYAECGVNPRDLKKDTKNGRGFSVTAACEMLRKAEWR